MTQIRIPRIQGRSPDCLGFTLSKGVTIRWIVTWYKRGLNAEEICDRTNSDILARLQVTVLQNPQAIEFLMVIRGQTWSELPET